MSAFITFTHRVLAPFFTGVLMASAAAADMRTSVPLVLAAIITGYASLPSAERLTRRVMGVLSEV